MHRLSPDSIEDFLGKFYYCNDSLIVSIDLKYGFEGSNTTILLTILCQHDGSEIENDWVRLIIEISTVEEFHLVQSPRTTSQVLSPRN